MDSLLESREWQAYFSAQVAYLEVHTAPRPPAETMEDHMAIDRERAARAPSRENVDLLMASVLRTLSAEHVPELLDRLDTSDLPLLQRPLAFVLNELVRTSDVRLLPVARDRWIELLERKARALYPRDGSPLTFLSWAAPDRARSVTLRLLSEVSSRELTEREAECVVSDVGRLGPSIAVEPLILLSRNPGLLGEKAAAQLERMGHPAGERVEQVAAEWRSTRAREPLTWLYGTVVSHLDRAPESLPRVLELLGTPTRSGGTSCAWDTVEPEGHYPICLQIGFDNHRMRAEWWKLK